MTLELKRYYNPQFGNSTEPYHLGGVKEITDKTKHGTNHFAITIFDRRVLVTDAFEYVKNHDTGEYFVKDGKWVGQTKTDYSGSFNSGIGCFTTCEIC